MPAEPRLAAACILVRGDAPELLLALRNPTLRFMGGHYVFPGGKIDDGETASRVVHASDAENGVTPAYHSSPTSVSGAAMTTPSLLYKAATWPADKAKP